MGCGCCKAAGKLCLSGFLVGQISGEASIFQLKNNHIFGPSPSVPSVPGVKQRWRPLLWSPVMVVELVVEWLLRWGRGLCWFGTSTTLLENYTGGYKVFIYIYIIYILYIYTYNYTRMSVWVSFGLSVLRLSLSPNTYIAYISLCFEMPHSLHFNWWNIWNIRTIRVGGFGGGRPTLAELRKLNEAGRIKPAGTAGFEG